MVNYVKPCIYVCETCRYSEAEATDESGHSGGKILHDKLAALAKQGGLSEHYDILTTRCLMGCDHHCNVHLRAPGKICYVIGRFEPNDDSAEAIIDYFEKYLQSDTGQVPYKSWPAGIKGHFISRIPPFDQREN